MMKRDFTLECWRDRDGWYVGHLRELPRVLSQGRTLAELEENIRDAYRLMTDLGQAAEEQIGLTVRLIRKQLGLE